MSVIILIQMSFSGVRKLIDKRFRFCNSFRRLHAENKFSVKISRDLKNYFAVVGVAEHVPSNVDLLRLLELRVLNSVGFVITGACLHRAREYFVNAAPQRCCTIRKRARTFIKLVLVIIVAAMRIAEIRIYAVNVSTGVAIDAC